MAGVSIRGFARLVGVSQTAVQKALRVGRIRRMPDGLIDTATAVHAWHANRRTTHANDGRQGGTPPAVAARPAAPEGPGIALLQQADLALRLEARRLDLDAKKGRLIDRAKAVALVQRLVREEREAALAMPARFGPAMAADLGVDPDRFAAVLAERLRHHLSDRGEPGAAL